MKYSLKGKSPNVPDSCYIAPGAQLIGDIELHEDSSIWFNAILRGDNDKILIGKGTNIQDGTVVHVDKDNPVHIGDNVTVGHNAIIHGCRIEDESLIGMGATILNGAVIGKGTIVAANALVLEGQTVKPGMLVAGVPAKPVKVLDEDQQKQIKKGAAHYIENGDFFKNSLEKFFY